MTSYPIHLDIDVAWGEMDSFGHVNNIIYFRYFESVRTYYFQAIGMPYPKPGQPTPGPILASTRCDFRRPVTFPDKLTAQAGCIRVGKSSFTLAYRLMSQAQQECVAEGESVVVYVDYGNGKSLPIPPEMLSAIDGVEGRLFQAEKEPG